MTTKEILKKKKELVDSLNACNTCIDEVPILIKYGCWESNPNDEMLGYVDYLCLCSQIDMKNAGIEKITVLKK